MSRENNSNARKLTRSVISGVAGLGDVVRLPIEAFNLLAPGRKSNFSRVRDEANRVLDEKGFGGRPEGTLESTLLSVPEYLTSGVVGIPLKGAQTAGKVAQSVGKFLSPTTGGAIGSAAATNILSRDPEAGLTAMAASLAPSIGGSLLKTIGNAGSRGFDYLRKSAIETGKSRQKNIKKELSKRAGSESINKAEHEVGGQLGRNAVVSAKKKIDKEFKTDFGIRDKIIDESAPDLKINVKPAYKSLINIYKSLESDSLKKTFLASPSGKTLKTLLDFASDDAIQARQKIIQRYAKKGKDINDIPEIKKYTDKDIDDRIQSIDPKKLGKLYIPYNDTKELLHNMYDKVSNASEIGTREQGRIKNIAGMINKNMHKAIKKSVHKEDYNFIKEVDNKYKDYSFNQKLDFNKVLDVNSNDMEAVYDAVKQTKPYLKKKSFYAENMDPEKRNMFAQTFLRDLGVKEGKLDIETLSENLSNLQSRQRNYIINMLNSENRDALKSSLSDLKLLKGLNEEGTLLGKLAPKHYGKSADALSYMASKDIDFLKRINGPKKDILAIPNLDAKASMTALHEPSNAIPSEDERYEYLKNKLGYNNPTSNPEALVVTQSPNPEISEDERYEYLKKKLGYS